MKLQRYLYCGLGVAALVASLTPARAQTTPLVQIKCTPGPNKTGISGPTLVVNPIPSAERRLCAGQQFHSPSGFYTAMVKPDTGEFIVARGDPTKPENIAWRNGVTRAATDFLLRLYPAYATGPTLMHVDYVLGHANGSYETGTMWEKKGSSEGSKGWYLHLSDEGTLTANYGSPTAPLGQMWTNGLNDPVEPAKGGVSVDSINYDFEGAKTAPPTQQIGGSLTCDNKASSVTVSCELALTLSYAKSSTYTFTESLALTLGYKATTKVGVPGLAEGTAEWSVTGTVGFSASQAFQDTETKSFQATIKVPVPANSVYKARIVGQQLNATIPFVYTGVATYKSGAKARLVDVPGVYEGTDTGDFKVEIICVSQPSGCTAAPKTMQLQRSATGVFVPRS